MTTPDTIHGRISVLDDEKAILVLRIVVEYARLPVLDDDWASVKDHLAETISASDLDPYTPVAGTRHSPGDLARATLRYQAETSKDWLNAVDSAITYVNKPGERFGLEPLALGSLVLAVLQTDLKLKRGTDGHWSFQLHKKAASDSALARVITTFIGHFTGSGNLPGPPD